MPPSRAATATRTARADAGARTSRCPKPGPLRVLGITVLGRLTSFRHLGLFPEQLPHWQWMLERLAACAATPRVLNLFAYTGLPR